MKKLLLTATALSLLVSASAYAEVNFDLNIGTPAVVAPAPVVVAPAPVIVQQPGVVYEHRRDRDWRYWQERRERERWEHDHPGGHWDHDRWMHDHR